MKENLKKLSCLSILFTAIVMSAEYCYADIYRFVTVDGIESFTDAPVAQDAKVVMKERSKMKPEQLNQIKVKNARDISMNEVIDKTGNAQFHRNELPLSDSIKLKLPPVGGKITSGVGMRIDPIDGKLHYHNGIDISIPEGTPITPVAAGVVIYTGIRPGYGYSVLVEHANGMISFYGHNSRLEVTQGQEVDQNTVIALSGNSGRSSGPHLHFEAWLSGTNITSSFMPGSPIKMPTFQLSAVKSKTNFRKEILSDGSVLFTNIPSSVP